MNMLPLSIDSPVLYPAILVRRYKRFLADVVLPTGETVTLHCPNTGAMKNCLEPMSPCWYSIAANPARKYPFTLEVVTTPQGYLAGINTSRANSLVEIALRTRKITALNDYDILRREFVYGDEGSRVDFLLGRAQQHCYLEVKNVTLMEAKGQGLFPDAVSARGTKHLRELMQMVRAGHRAVLLFCVQHNGIEWVEPADGIDMDYGVTLREAIEVGVEVLAYRTTIKPDQNYIVLDKQVPVKVPLRAAQG